MTRRGREGARIDRGSPIPLYFQIAQRLRAELATTPLSSGPLYTEEELGRRFGVHRLTIRQALKELERDGLVYRQRGVGTFRAPPKLLGEPVYLDSFVDLGVPQRPARPVEERRDPRRLHPRGLDDLVGEHDPRLRGDRVRVSLRNMSMEAHPMHLHGQSFRLLAVNGARIRAPIIKDSQDVEAHMGSAVVEFTAHNPGDWFFHCHKPMHMEGGMIVLAQIAGA